MERKKYYCFLPCYMGRKICCASCLQDPKRTFKCYVSRSLCPLVGKASRYCSAKIPEDIYHWQQLLGEKVTGKFKLKIRVDALWKRRARTFRRIISLKELFEREKE